LLFISFIRRKKKKLLHLIKKNLSGEAEEEEEEWKQLLPFILKRPAFNSTEWRNDKHFREHFI